MQNEQFEWDDRKAKLNWRKHGVAFLQACEVFDDTSAIEVLDDTDTHHGLDGEVEERLIIVGIDNRTRVITVVYTWRGRRRRLITARLAAAFEKRGYFENRSAY